MVGTRAVSERYSSTNRIVGTASDDITFIYCANGTFTWVPSTTDVQ
jgi:hypothetical protein